MRVAFITALLAGLAQAKLSDTQISSVFPDSTELFGSDVTFPSAFDGSFVANSTHLLSVLTPTGSGEVGWIGLGSGSKMVGSDMFIFWPNSGKWIMSHGVATGYMSPKDTGDDPEEYSLVDSLTTTSSVAFLRKLAPLKLAKQPVIFARASENPGSSDPGATKSYHDVAFASTSLDLSTKIAAPKAAPAPEAPAPKASPASSKVAAPEPSIEVPAVKEPPSEPASKAADKSKAPKVMPEPSSPVSMSSSLRHRPNHKTHVYPRPRSSHASIASGMKSKKKKNTPASSGVSSSRVFAASPMPKISSAAQLDMTPASSEGFSIAQASLSGAERHFASLSLIALVCFSMLLLL